MQHKKNIQTAVEQLKTAEKIYSKFWTNKWITEDPSKMTADLGKVIRLLRKAASSEYAPAQCKLGDLILSGYIGLYERLKYIRAHKLPHAIVETQKEKERETKDAISWFMAAAKQGYAPAMNELGLMCSKPGYQKYVKWFDKAAELGDIDSWAHLGSSYCFKTWGRKKLDKKKGFEWYKKAADKGRSDAQHMLGYLYSRGIGVPRNIKIALKWYAKSEKSGGSGWGYVRIGEIYEKGIGVKKDLTKALYYYLKGYSGFKPRKPWHEIKIASLYVLRNKGIKDCDKARECYARALHMARNDPKQVKLIQRALTRIKDK